MNFASIRIVLVATSHPGNIGSTARAMKTMGLSHLYLVSPKDFPAQKAYEMAAGADDILNQAVITNSLEEALKGCQLVFATSARPRGIALPGVTPRECAELVFNRKIDTQVAILFGREHAGLTNEELLHSHYHVNILANPEYSSLNLAQAVQIISYELRMKHLAPLAEVQPRKDKSATAEEIEGFYYHLTEVLKEINFLKPTNPTRKLQQRIRRLFNRTQLEQKEITILRGILSQVQYSLRCLKEKN